MNKVLVAYFSVSGVTARAAAEIAEAEGADLFEISPEKPYTKADLDWTDKQSRSTLEMSDLNCRPAIRGAVENMKAMTRYSSAFRSGGAGSPVLSTRFSMPVTSPERPYIRSAHPAAETPIRRPKESAPCSEREPW